MRKSLKYLIILSSCVIILFFAVNVNALWKYNPFTNKFDYYESDTGEDSRLTIPQDYIATPTLTNLRDVLIAAGIMSAAPVSLEIVWEDTSEVVFNDTTVVVWEDCNW